MGTFALQLWDLFLFIPLDDSAGKIIRQEIIPAVAHLRQMFPLVLDSLFPPFFLEYYKFSAGQRLDCTNVTAFDKYISGAFIFKCVDLFAC